MRAKQGLSRRLQWIVWGIAESSGPLRSKCQPSQFAFVCKRSWSMKVTASNESGRNMEIEMERNSDRFQFLKWAQQSFQNFNLVSHGMQVLTFNGSVE